MRLACCLMLAGLSGCVLIGFDELPEDVPDASPSDGGMDAEADAGDAGVGDAGEDAAPGDAATRCPSVGTCEGDVWVGCEDDGGLRRIDCAQNPDADPHCEKGVCDPVEGCLIERLPDGTHCEDGEFCFSDDVCESGQCKPGPTEVCASEASLCRDAFCDEAEDLCWTEARNEGGSCGTGLLCKSGVCSSSELCAESTCEYTCSADNGPCEFSCVESTQCSVTCSDATCSVACGTGECAVTCTESATCTVDCTLGGCDAVSCGAESQCKLECGNNDVCRFAECASPQSCEQGIVVCNRECP